eukprot:gene7991-8849_t
MTKSSIERQYEMKSLGWEANQEFQKLHLKKMLSAYCSAKTERHHEAKHAAHSKTQPILPELPQVVIDPNTGKRFFRGRMLGKGGFARCYEVTDMQTDKKYACKAISKLRIAKPHQKDKIANEVELHKSIKHKYVVAFHGYFEDDENVYILLELCSRKSLVQLLKQRRTLTEPEVRYYIHQTIQGVCNIHDNRIIHRDIKLGNLFLNEDMDIRIGDFGLAVRLQDDNKKEMSVCGTPNYIAPEVLGKGGHSFEVDTWAIGCVMYTLLVGRPPFETSCLKDTYMRIRNNEYAIPSRVSRPAANLIQRLLSERPEDRPSLNTLFKDSFFTKGFFPRSLPAVSCMTPPKFNHTNSKYSRSNNRNSSPRRNQHVIARDGGYSSSSKSHSGNEVGVGGGVNQLRNAMSNLNFNADEKKADLLRKKLENVESGVESQDSNGHELSNSLDESSHDFCNPRPLFHRLTSCLDAMPDPNSSGRSDPISTGTSDSEDEHYEARRDVCTSKPNRLWITKWVDYSNKYGFGAQLSNGCLVIRFNDATTLAMTSDKKRLQYFDEDRNLFRFSVNNIPDDLLRKVTLLNYFGNYMDKHLLKGGDLVERPRSDDFTEIPIIDTWFRTEKAMVMYLSNGTLQVNFLSDHTKIILSPGGVHRDVITYIDRQRESTSINFTTITRKGCNEEISERLYYCRMVLQKLTEVYQENDQSTQ